MVNAFFPPPKSPLYMHFIVIFARERENLHNAKKGEMGLRQCDVLM